MSKLVVFVLSLAMLLSACGPVIPATGEVTPVEITAGVGTVIAQTLGPPPTEGPSPTPAPPTPIPTLPSSSLSPTELKYRVLEQFPDFFFCDPDFYPVGRGDEMTLAIQRFPDIQADQEEFQAILNQTGLSGATTFTDDQKLLIYREHKRLAAIHFDQAGDRFQFQIQTGTEGQQGSLITGTIDGNGSIEIVQQDPGFPTCPICLAAGTRIDTPRGPIAVEHLQVGDPVWTVDDAGERVPGIVLQIGSTRVPPTHQVVHVRLRDGRELWASPGHPTAGGRALDDLEVGDLLDGAQVTHIEYLPYEGTSTYDLLPSGETGFYWANGILMSSTRAEP